MLTVSKQTVTLCGHVMSIMSVMLVYKKSNNILQARYKILYDQFVNRESLLRSSHCLSFYQFNFFLVKKKFLQKMVIVMVMVIVVISMLHNMKVK